MLKTVWWAIILANVSDDAVTLVEGACFQFMETMKAKVVNRRSVERGAYRPSLPDGPAKVDLKILPTCV